MYRLGLSGIEWVMNLFKQPKAHCYSDYAQLRLGEVSIEICKNFASRESAILSLLEQSLRSKFFLDGDYLVRPKLVKLLTGAAGPMDLQFIYLARIS